MTTYLVFSLDEMCCEDVWKCFSDRDSARHFLRNAYDEEQRTFEKYFGRCSVAELSDGWDYAHIAWQDPYSHENHETEFFLVQIPDSKILKSRICHAESA